MITIQQLRKAKFCIKIYHLRFYTDFVGHIWLKIKSQVKEDDNLMQKGGETRLDITDPNGQFDFESALCRPDFYIADNKIFKQKGDAYNRKLGVKIALGRYLKRSGLSPKNILKDKY